MTDPYVVDGVTITPQPGGYYQLAHSSLEAPERLQGKEKADSRAKEIAAEAVAAEQGRMDPQGQELPATPPPPPPVNEEQAPEKQAEDDRPTADLDTAPTPTAGVSPDVAALMALVEKQSTMLQTLLSQPARTVTVDPGVADEDVVTHAQAARTIPTKFSGIVDEETRIAAEKVGITYRRIILEENSDIPPTGLFLGHNGRSYMIKPGEEVDVPDFLINVLNDAVMAAAITDPSTQKIIGYRSRLKYPYRRMD